MKIVVLSGGLSSERNVSILSGFQVYNALKSKGHSVVFLDVFLGYEKDLESIEDLFKNCYAFTDDFKFDTEFPDIENVKLLRKKSDECFIGNNVIKICQNADITFFALHGGEGENGQLQATFDIFGIKYTGSGYFGSAIAMDKAVTKSILKQNDISCPVGKVFINSEDENYDWSYFPCVVKPCNGGSSVGVSKVNNIEDFHEALKKAFLWEKKVLVEQFIEGREFSIGVIDGKALPVIEIIPKSGFYDYENKYQAGKALEICPAEIDDNTTDLLKLQAENAFRALGLEAYARIDFLLDSNGRCYCLEANTLPGMTKTSLIPQEAKEIGLDYAELCEKMIEVSLKKYNL